MQKASQGDTAPAKEKMRQPHPMITSTSCGRATLLGEASRILVTLGVAGGSKTRSLLSTSLDRPVERPRGEKTWPLTPASIGATLPDRPYRGNRARYEPS